MVGWWEVEKVGRCLLEDDAGCVGCVCDEEVGEDEVGEELYSAHECLDRENRTKCAYLKTS